MKELKYIVASVIVHGLLFSSFLFDWNFREKASYVNNEVLLVGPKTGDKINPQPKEVVKQKAPKNAPVVENDPDALKTFDKNAPDLNAQPSEGTFGQGGTKPLDYYTELSAWIKVNRKYPKLARRLGQECEAITLEFTIYPDGRLDNITIKEKCQYDTLNQAAEEMIRASSPFKPFPANFPKTPQKQVFEVAYKLEQQ
jgi:TonB family protein